MQDIFKGFQDVNKATEGESYFQVLDGMEALDCVQECKRRMLELCPVREGDRVLDVGCGVGHEVQRLAQRVGQSGRVVGIDLGESIIAEANRRAARQSLSLEIKVGDVCQLDFAADSFDLCRAERVLIFLEDLQQALNEMVRVVRPGGHLVLFDFDHDGFVLEHSDQALFRRIKDLLFDAVPNGAMPRQMPGLLRETGLTDIRVVPQVCMCPYPLWRNLARGTLVKGMGAGKISAPELERWWSELDEADQQGRFFEASLGFIVVGRKP